ncbi:MAG: metallophosphoesterase family protein [Gaiellaceae bacterium]|jgi:predicted phosphodiesterase
MRVAVISDVHSNLHALEAVEQAIERERPDEVWNLGDTVGYGPRPNECCHDLEQLATISLVGNHDLASIGQLPLDEFAPIAASAVAWTRDELGARARAYLEELAPMSRVSGCALYHGSPREPVWSYVIKTAEVIEALSLTVEPLVLVGHTHFPMAASLAGEQLDFSLAPAGTVVDLARGRWLLNPGSVGQPRDGDPRAAYLLLDLDAGRAEFKRADYEIALTQAEIRERGLPEQLAIRLSHGH